MSPCTAWIKKSGKTTGAVKQAPANHVVANNPGNLVKTGYQLVGWNTAADYTRYIQGLNGAYYNTPPSGSSLALYAEWMPADYQVVITPTYGGDPNTGLELQRFSDTPSGTLTIANGITYLSQVFLQYATVTQISIPETVTTIENLALYKSTVTTFVVSSSNPAFTVVSGALLTKDQTTLVAYPAAITIPVSVTAIGAAGFSTYASQIVTP